MLLCLVSSPTSFSTLTLPPIVPCHRFRERRNRNFVRLLVLVPLQRRNRHQISGSFPLRCVSVTPFGTGPFTQDLLTLGATKDGRDCGRRRPWLSLHWLVCWLRNDTSFLVRTGSCSVLAQYPRGSVRVNLMSVKEKDGDS